MKKNILSLLIVLFTNFFVVHAQQLNSQFEVFLAQLGDHSLEEIEEDLDKGIKELKSFEVFFETSRNEEKIKDFSKEEERFSSHFNIDTTKAAKAVLQFKNIGFQQEFKNHKSLIKFTKLNSKYWSRLRMDEGMEEIFIPRTIYYKNGTAVSKNIADYKTSFFWGESWGNVAIIDSIQLDYNLKFIAKYDSLLVNKNSKKVKYKDGFIKIERLEKNHVYITISDPYAKNVIVRGLNSDGKPLSSNSSSSSSRSAKDSKNNFKEMISLLEEVQMKLKANKFKDIKALKSHLLRKSENLKKLEDNDGVYHKKIFFNGNLSSIKLYMITDWKTKNISFTAKRAKPFGSVILMQTATENIFLNGNNAKEFFKTNYLPIKSLGARYYKKEQQYFHLNLKKKKLEELDVAEVFEASNGLAFIKKQTTDAFEMYNAEYKLISKLSFQKASDIDHRYVLGEDSNSVNYIINGQGKIKKLEGIRSLWELSEGRIKALSTSGKYGFLDASGEVIIPFQYNNASSFSEGISTVSNEKLRYGYIDVNGNQIIPFKYEIARDFENGIALVAYNKNTYLINVKEEVIVRSKGIGYSVNGSGLNKTYTLGTKSYNALGELIK